MGCSDLMTVEQMQQLLHPFHRGLSAGQLLLFCKYLDVLLHWNQALNLTAISDPEEIVIRHFGESIFGSQILQFPHGRLADVGSGAGFPGLPLKIVSPDLQLTLIEPNGKKCAFMTELSRELGLEDVSIVRSRYEDSDLRPGSVDILTCRALGNYKQLLRWALPILNSSGSVLLWLGTEDSLRVSRLQGWTWDLPVWIPESRHRVILSGRPSSSR